MMMGPMKKKMITVGIISFLLPTIIAGVVFYKYKTTKEAEITALSEEVAVVTRYVFSGDMPINHVIGSNDVVAVKVKATSAPYDSCTPDGEVGDEPTALYGLGSIVGRKLKIAAFDRTIVTESMFHNEDEEEIRNDLRKKEFNMITLPSDLVEGDYIDIRMQHPTGEDFLVLVGKEVKQLGMHADTNTIFLELTEDELVKLSGAIIESYMEEGIKLYAIKYVNSNQQLFREEPIDYVEKYEVALEELISGDYENDLAIAIAEGNYLKNESGEMIPDDNNEPQYLVERKTVDDYEIETIAEKAGMSVEIAENIKMAKADNDELLLDYYANRTIVVSDMLEPNYPIRPEIYALLQRNPNILLTLEEKYNIESLMAQRDSLVSTEIFKTDPYTGEYGPDESVIGQIAGKLSAEISTQKTERKEFLQNMIRNNVAGY